MDKALDFDQASGINLCGGDKELYLSTLKTFCQDKPETQKKLVQFLMTEDWLNYQIIVHSLKSNSLLIGSKNFSDLAFQLESACKDIQDKSDVEKRIQFIESHHGQFMQMYDNLVDLASKIS